MTSSSSTAAHDRHLNPAGAFPAASRTQAVIARAAWKEYRMLRGFALGVIVIAALVMAAAVSLAVGITRAETALAIAWGGAAMFAVGAAVTLFAVEREEGTHALLQLLPAHHAALVAGKALAALASSIAVAAALLIIARLIVGDWPNSGTASEISATGATAIVEGLAWGMLASLLIRQPLLAAIAAIAAASLAAQIVIIGSSQSGQGATLQEYGDAVPGRLALAAAVTALDAWLALRWLRPTTHGLSARNSLTVAPLTPASAAAIASMSMASRAVPGPGKLVVPRPGGATTWPRIFWRLTWQGWREGAPAMLAAIAIGAFLMAVSLLFPHSAASLLVIPALLGALVFRADQRDHRHRFLAVHGVRPSAVWAARQAVWLTPLVILAASGTLAVWAGMLLYLKKDLLRALAGDYSVYHSGRQSDAWQTAPQLVAQLDDARVAGALTALAWCAAFAAYGLGQACSLAIRSTVLAGFAALLLSVILVAWSVLIGSWILPAWAFVAPLGVAALAATFIYSRAWLAERRGWRPWLAPVAILASTLLALCVLIPPVRLAQVNWRLPYQFLREPLDVTLARWEAEQPAARDVAQRYDQIGAAAEAILENARPDEPQAGRDGPILELPPHVLSSLGWPPGAIAYGDRPPTAEELALLQDQFDQADQASRALRCWLTERHDPFWNLAGLLFADARGAVGVGELDRALARLLTLRRMEAHAAQYQPHIANPGTLFLAPQLQELWLRWATASNQTSARLTTAVEQLFAAERAFPAARETVIAHHQRLVAIVRGEQSPSFMQTGDGRPRRPDLSEWSALVANELPSERRRALQALAHMTEAEADYVDAVSGHLSPRDSNVQPLHFDQQLNAAIIGGVSGSVPGLEQIPSPAVFTHVYQWRFVEAQHRLLEASSTSWLPAMEFGRLKQILRADLQTALQHYLERQATRELHRLRLALVAYRLDNGAYPETLKRLVPDYLPGGMLADPFATSEFCYDPDGFDVPVVTSSMLDSGEFIPPRTPLLWSPGPGYHEPHELWLALSYDEKIDVANGEVVREPRRHWLETDWENQRWTRDHGAGGTKVIHFRPRHQWGDVLLLTLPTPNAE